MTAQRARIRHHFTVDVEEYFQVAALAPYVPRSSWETRETRLAVGMDALLELLAAGGSRGTFFTLGWIAQRHPGVVRAIVSGGHELASHGWGHEKVTTLTHAEFRQSVRDSKAILEDLSGAPIYGYRAPSFSILRGGEWALDILAEEGYRYDSSLFPIWRPGYGYAGGQRDPHRIDTAAGPLDELPPATVKVGPAVLPAAGGAYFRHFPFSLAKAGLVAAERRGAPGMFYIHPWELDPDQPRLPVPLKTRLRHYGGVRRTVPRLRRLFAAFQFQPVAETLGLGNTEGQRGALASVKGAS